jgi:L-2-hydroxyglutarate oxidase LhgO
VTLDLAGRVRLGPDAEYCASKEDFAPREDKLAAFAQAAGRLLGEVREDQLSYDGCGIRAKLRAPDESGEKDFVLCEDRPGFVNLVGIDSPGLTASLALAELLA